MEILITGTDIPAAVDVVVNGAKYVPENPVPAPAPAPTEPPPAETGTTAPPANTGTTTPPDVVPPPVPSPEPAPAPGASPWRSLALPAATNPFTSWDGSNTGGAKHVWMEYCPDTKRVYSYGGDFGHGVFGQPPSGKVLETPGPANQPGVGMKYTFDGSLRNDMYSLDPYDQSGAWRLEHPYFPRDMGGVPEQRPARPDQAGLVWDAKRKKFWAMYSVLRNEYFDQCLPDGTPNPWAIGNAHTNTPAVMAQNAAGVWKPTASGSFSPDGAYSWTPNPAGGAGMWAKESDACIRYQMGQPTRYEGDVLITGAGDERVGLWAMVPAQDRIYGFGNGLLFALACDAQKIEYWTGAERAGSTYWDMSASYMAVIDEWIYGVCWANHPTFGHQSLLVGIDTSKLGAPGTPIPQDAMRFIPLPWSLDKTSSWEANGTIPAGTGKMQEHAMLGTLGREITVAVCYDGIINDAGVTRMGMFNHDTQTWRQGADAPQQIYASSGVPLPETGEFMLTNTTAAPPYDAAVAWFFNVRGADVSPPDPGAGVPVPAPEPVPVPDPAPVDPAPAPAPDPAPAPVDAGAGTVGPAPAEPPVIAPARFACEYFFPQSFADLAGFPCTNWGFKANAWHSAFLSKSGLNIVEWGDNNHSEFGWNALRLIPLNCSPAFDLWKTDFKTATKAGATGANTPLGVPHYNNHVELYYAKGAEEWWLKFYGGGRYDLTSGKAVLTHRAAKNVLDEMDWAGPDLSAFVRDDTHEQWFTGATLNTVYNPAYDFCDADDSWLFVGGGAGSDSPCNGCWKMERNSAGPQPWLIRNFKLVGDPADIADLLGGYQWRNHARFRGLWMYVMGGRRKNTAVNNYQGAPGVVQQQLIGSRRFYRIHVQTGEVQRLPDMPAMICDGMLAYDKDADVLVAVGVAHDKDVVTSIQGNAIPPDMIAGMALIPQSAPPCYTDDLCDNSRNCVVVMDASTLDAWHDVTPAGFRSPAHPIGGWKAPDGVIRYRASGFNPPTRNNQSENWLYTAYQGLRLSRLS